MKLFIRGLLDDTSPTASTLQLHAVITKNELERIVPVDVGLRPLCCWDHGFLSRSGHGCSSVVFFVCCVGSGLCDELTGRSEDSYWVCVCVCVCVSNCVCVCVCVWSRNLTMKPPRPQLGCCTVEEADQEQGELGRMNKESHQILSGWSTWRG